MITASTSPALERRPRTDSLAWLMGTITALVDIFTLSIAVVAGFRCWSFINPAIPPLHPSMWLAVGFSCAALAFNGLYPGIGMTAVEHMQIGRAVFFELIEVS